MNFRQFSHLLEQEPVYYNTVWYKLYEIEVVRRKKNVNKSCIWNDVVLKWGIVRVGVYEGIDFFEFQP